MIDLDDEEEIDDVEKEVIDLETPKKADKSEDKPGKRTLEDGDASESKKTKKDETGEAEENKE